MSRSQHPSTTFLVPEPANGFHAASSANREAKPFVIVPASMVMADDKLEPHWHPAIDAATD